MNKSLYSVFFVLFLFFAADSYAEGHPQYHLTLYYKVDCPYCQKVIRHLNMNGVAIPLREVNQDYSYREALRGMLGRSQVPCLVVDGQPMVESDEIIQWVDEHLIHSVVQ